MLYFAYGSNMSRGPMQARCPTARESGLAILPGYRLLIMANGYASVTPAAGGQVLGLLWRIDPQDLAALDDYEDVAGGLYRQATLPVLHDGETVNALVYLGVEAREGRPRPGYIALVVAGARECGLPEDYIERLARLEFGAER